MLKLIIVMHHIAVTDASIICIFWNYIHTLKHVAKAVKERFNVINSTPSTIRLVLLNSQTVKAKALRSLTVSGMLHRDRLSKQMQIGCDHHTAPSPHCTEFAWWWLSSY